MKPQIPGTAHSRSLYTRILEYHVQTQRICIIICLLHIARTCRRRARTHGRRPPRAPAPGSRGRHRARRASRTRACSMPLCQRAQRRRCPASRWCWWTRSRSTTSCCQVPVPRLYAVLVHTSSPGLHDGLLTCPVSMPCLVPLLSRLVHARQHARHGWHSCDAAVRQGLLCRRAAALGPLS